MASAMDIRADSVLEGHRPSLLEVIEDKNRALNKVTSFRIYLKQHTVKKSKILRYHIVNIGFSTFAPIAGVLFPGQAPRAQINGM